ncbi:hypothetical protein A5701_15460 [Mycobacterium sp. E3305]|nr:hypothetical protein A5701_15460 [Mycobacterium sp. E3305]
MHTIATFAFAQMRRDPGFAVRFPWVRNTVVCVESDLAADVLDGQVAHYFPGVQATIACYYPRDHRMMFIRVEGPYKADDKSRDPDAITADNSAGQLTIGMLVDSIYRHRGGNYSDLPVFGRWQAGKPSQPGSVLVGEASTIEAEKKLALA